MTLKKKVFKALRWLVTLLLLLYVFYKAGVFDPLGRAALVKLIVSTDLLMFWASIAIAFVGNFACVLKWWMLVRSRKIPFGFGRAYLYHMVGRFFNLVLPTSMGGDVVRVHELGRHTGRRAEAAASVFVERFSGMVTLFVLAVITVLMNLQTFDAPIIVASLLFLLPIIGLLYWLIIDTRPIRYIEKVLCGRSAVLDGVFMKIWKVHAAVHQYRGDLPALFFAFLNSVLFYVIAVINVWVSGLAFDGTLELYKIFMAVPVLLLIMNLPVSIGGFGLMEFAYAFTFELIGYSVQVAFSVALLMRLKSFIDAAIGGMMYLFIGKGRSIRQEIIENRVP